jgi:hypothetical protein
MEHEDEQMQGYTKGQQLFKFMLQEDFDGRYVIKDGAYKIIVAVVVGACGLILTGVIGVVFSFYIHLPK